MVTDRRCYVFVYNIPFWYMDGKNKDLQSQLHFCTFIVGYKFRLSWRAINGCNIYFCTVQNSAMLKCNDWLYLEYRSVCIFNNLKMAFRESRNM
jgi:hypothetical protein